MSKAEPAKSDLQVVVMVTENQLKQKEVQLQLSTLKGEWMNSYLFSPAAARVLGEALIKASDMAASPIHLVRGADVLRDIARASNPTLLPDGFKEAEGDS